jgi:predicted RNA-binding Zn-ribbon protein involved in translation (DUF1610 family)
MARKSRYTTVPIMFWRCPHCGFEHRASDLLRNGWDTFQCKECGKTFPARPSEERKASSD